MLTGVAEPELNAGKEKDAGAWEAETQKQQLQEWRFSGARGRDSNQMVWFRFFQSAERKRQTSKKDLSLRFSFLPSLPPVTFDIGVGEPLHLAWDRHT